MDENTTILVAEDETSLREVYVHWIEFDSEATVIEAENGEEAVEKWSDEIDVAILDRRMPKMNGDEALEEIREQGYHTPVMMATAVDPYLDVEEMEFDEYIQKPLDKDEVFEVIEELLPLSDSRETVRNFARVSKKIHMLQSKHPTPLLKTHAEYQELKRQFNEYKESIAQMSDDLSEYEMEILNDIGQLN